MSSLRAFGVQSTICVRARPSASGCEGRLALIEDMEGRMRTLGAQVREARDAAERMRTAAEERLGVIERQQAGLVARDAEIAAKTAISRSSRRWWGAPR